ncbi:hypothetical protein [Ferrovibrio terrae]|uniref:hypothetical protein n=1 Tax=Ferrovibrio terrae TaxID=2594003 RepID=UPI0031377209
MLQDAYLARKSARRAGRTKPAKLGKAVIAAAGHHKLAANADQAARDAFIQGERETGEQHQRQAEKHRTRASELACGERGYRRDVDYDAYETGMASPAYRGRA